MIKELLPPITASLNSSKLLDETVANVKARTDVHCEFVITNDSSTDYLLEIITERSNYDPRFKILSISKKGAVFVRNHSIKYAKGKSQAL